MTRSLLVAVVALSMVVGCGDDDGAATPDSGGGGVDAGGGGPIDGTWTVNTLTCNGTMQMIPMLTVTIDDTSGTFVIAIPTVCTATITETYSYPSASSIMITPTANDCAPDGAACMPVFMTDTCPTPPPTTFDYVLSGTMLTFTRTSVGPPVDPFCAAGEMVEYQMTR